MADLELFWDPMCPFAWITSRWVLEVARQRPLEVRWRPISLAMLNEASYDEDEELGWKRQAHLMGLALLRVAAAVDADHGNESEGRLYTAFGSALHLGDREATVKRGPASIAEGSLEACGLPTGLAEAVDDDSWDVVIRQSTDEAIKRTGPDLGTPILTFSPPDGPSFFGPVISVVPRGPAAMTLWDAVETLAHHPSFAEIKRSLRQPPQVAS